VVTTFAGSAPPSGAAGVANGLGTAARFNGPNGLAADTNPLSPRFGWLFVAEWSNCAVRLVSPAGAVSTLAGAVGACAPFAPGVGGGAAMQGLAGIWVAASGYAFVAAQTDSKILQVAPDGATALAFPAPAATTAVAVHPWSQAVYVAGGNIIYEMVCPPTASQTPSGSPSRTRSATLTGTTTASQTGTPTPPLSLGATPSVTPSGTATPSFTPSPSRTPRRQPPAPRLPSRAPARRAARTARAQTRASTSPLPLPLKAPP